MPDAAPHGAAPSSSDPRTYSTKIDAVHELHREETIRVVHDQLVERHQVRVRDVCQAAELPLEPVDVGRPRAKQRFQRDDFVADLVVHFVDDAHAARAQLPAHGEALGPSELRARSKRGQWRLDRRGIVSRRKDAERIRGDRRFEEPARTLVCAHEAIELVPQDIVSRAGLGKESRPLLRARGRWPPGTTPRYVASDGYPSPETPVTLHR